MAETWKNERGFLRDLKKKLSLVNYTTDHPESLEITKDEANRIINEFNRLERVNTSLTILHKKLSSKEQENNNAND